MRRTILPEEQQMKARQSTIGIVLAVMVSGSAVAQNDKAFDCLKTTGVVAESFMKARQYGDKTYEEMQHIFDQEMAKYGDESIVELYEIILQAAYDVDIQTTDEAKREAIDGFRNWVLTKTC